MYIDFTPGCSNWEWQKSVWKHTAEGNTSVIRKPCRGFKISADWTLYYCKSHTVVRARYTVKLSHTCLKKSIVNIWNWAKIFYWLQKYCAWFCRRQYSIAAVFMGQAVNPVFIKPGSCSIGANPWTATDYFYCKSQVFLKQSPRSVAFEGNHWVNSPDLR